MKIPAHSLAQTGRPVLVIGAALLWVAGCWAPQGEARPKPGDTMLLAPQTPAQEKLFADGPVCRIAAFSRAVASYDFGGDLSEHFVRSSRWLSHESILVQVAGNRAEVTADGTRISEAWLAWHESLPASRSWRLSSHVTVPKAWDTGKSGEAQVGIGMFVGKSSAQDANSDDAYRRQSPTVYEVNLATVTDDLRFIQAQMIGNRLGFDPDQTAAAVVDRESLTLDILYCAEDRTLSVYYDGIRLDTQAIDAIGRVDWHLEDGELLDVGIMGFAENTDLQSDAPSIGDFRICERI